MRMCHFWTQNRPFVINKFILVQTIAITFIYLLALFIVQNFKKILTKNPELWESIIFGPQMIHLPQTFFFFWKKIINVIFIYLLAPFILQNFEKILTANPDLRGCSTFGPKIPQFVLNKICWYKLLLLLSSTYWPFSLGKILKIFLQLVKSYEDAPFLGPKWTTCPKFFLENY